MNNDLHSIRISSTCENFRVWRNEFEYKYCYAFDCASPRCFSFLYRPIQRLLIRIYKNLHMPMRFLFQDTGYSKSVNSIFCYYILQQVVPHFTCPTKILELKKRKKARTRSLAQMKGPIFRRPPTPSLGIPQERIPDPLPRVQCKLFTEFSWYQG